MKYNKIPMFIQANHDTVIREKERQINEIEQEQKRRIMKERRLQERINTVTGILFIIAIVEIVFWIMLEWNIFGMLTFIRKLFGITV